MLKIMAALALIAAPALATAQSPAVEAAMAAGKDYDDEGARAILTEACDAGDTAACRPLLASLSDMFDDEAQAAARSLAERLCEGGDGLACITLARHAESGNNGDPDDALKRSSLIAACRAGMLSACSEASFLAEIGTGGDEDMDLARELSGKGCAGNHGQSCTNVGNYLYNEGWQVESDAQREAMWVQARRAFTRGCEHHNNNSCSRLADMLMEGHGGEEDLGRAQELLEAECARDYYMCETWLRSMAP